MMIDPSARQRDLALARRILRGETELWPALCRGAERENPLRCIRICDEADLSIWSIPSGRAVPESV